MRELDDIIGVIVELKSVERVAPVHGKKLLTYLRLMSKRVGLLLNVGENTLVEACAALSTISLPPRRRVSAWANRR